MATYIYVLKLTECCYYVGKTKDVKTRYKQHCEGKYGAAWTRLHAPLELIESYESSDIFEETRKTKELMAIHGINKVRGGAYTTIELDQSTIDFIQQEIWSAQDKCTRCGNDSHHILECRARWDINGCLLKRSYYR